MPRQTRCYCLILLCDRKLKNTVLIQNMGDVLILTDDLHLYLANVSQKSGVQVFDLQGAEKQHLFIGASTFTQLDLLFHQIRAAYCLTYGRMPTPDLLLLRKPKTPAKTTSPLELFSTLHLSTCA